MPRSVRRWTWPGWETNLHSPSRTDILKPTFENRLAREKAILCIPEKTGLRNVSSSWFLHPPVPAWIPSHFCKNHFFSTVWRKVEANSWDPWRQFPLFPANSSDRVPPGFRSPLLHQRFVPSILLVRESFPPCLELTRFCSFFYHWVHASFRFNYRPQVSFLEPSSEATLTLKKTRVIQPGNEQQDTCHQNGTFCINYYPQVSFLESNSEITFTLKKTRVIQPGNKHQVDYCPQVSFLEPSSKITFTLKKSLVTQPGNEP